MTSVGLAQQEPVQPVVLATLNQFQIIIQKLSVRFGYTFCLVLTQSGGEFVARYRGVSIRIRRRPPAQALAKGLVSLGQFANQLVAVTVDLVIPY
jgi:hypothetical protein